MAKILVVNNDFDTMTLLKTWLERREHKVTFTSAAEDVADIINKFKPDVLLVDVLQGKVIDELKTHNHTKEIPVILMTGYTLPKKTASTHRADDIVEKPFDLVLLQDKIEQFLKNTG